MKRALFLLSLFLVLLPVSTWAMLTGANFAVSTFGGPLSSGAAAGSTFTVASGTGSLFPQSGNFKLVLFSAGCAQASTCGQKEIITASYNGTTPDTFNVVSRGDESTTAGNWNTGDKIVLAPTWAYFEEIDNALANGVTAGTGLSGNGTASQPLVNTGVLSVTATPPLAVTGGQNPDVSLSGGVLPIANGGTGSSTQNFVDFSSSQTLSNKTLDSPIINGTPTGTGLPTTYYSRGAGAYSTTSTTFTQASSPVVTFTVPSTGWVADITVGGQFYSQISGDSCGVGIDIDGVVQNAVEYTSSVTAQAFALSYIYRGSAGTHTVGLALAAQGGGNAAYLMYSPPDVSFIIVKVYPSN